MFNFIDILGPEIKLTIKSESNFKTSFGAWSTLCLLLLIFAAFLGFGSDIFVRKKPKVTFNRIVNDQLPFKNITGSNFLFAMYDQASDKPIADFNRRFFASFDYYNTFANGISIVQRRIPFEKCSPEVINQWKGYYARVGSANYICFPQNQTWALSGIILQGNYTSIRIQLEFCLNNTDPTIGPVRSDCISKNDTVNFLSGKRIQMHYIIETTLIDSLNYTTPGSIIAYTGYTNTDSLSWNRLTLLFKNLMTDTDQGFFTESNSFLSFEAVESIQTEAIYSPQTTAVFSHLLGNSRYKEVYTRTYIKIQDIFAMMGGFISASTIILRFLVNYFQKPKMVDIFNNIIKLKCVDSYTSSGSLNEEKKEKKENSDVKFFENNKSFPAIGKIYINNIRSSPKIIANKDEAPGFRNIELEGVNAKDGNHMRQHQTEFSSLFKKLMILKKKNYSFKINSFQKTFNCCFSKGNLLKTQIDNYIEVENKLTKTISLENLAKNTILLKFLKEILLENYHLEILKVCQYPKSNKK